MLRHALVAGTLTACSTGVVETDSDKYAKAVERSAKKSNVYLDGGWITSDLYHRPFRCEWKLAADTLEPTTNGETTTYYLAHYSLLGGTSQNHDLSDAVVFAQDQMLGSPSTRMMPELLGAVVQSMGRAGYVAQGVTRRDGFCDPTNALKGGCWSRTLTEIPISMLRSAVDEGGLRVSYGKRRADGQTSPGNTCTLPPHLVEGFLSAVEPHAS